MGGLQTLGIPCYKSQPQDQSFHNQQQRGIKLCHLSLQICQNLETPKTLSISPLGYIYSDRLPHDGLTFFGYIQKQYQKRLDILIPAPSDIQKKFPGPQFCILYIWALNHYLIKDLGTGLGTFQKVTDSIAIRDGLLIQCGSKFLLFNPGCSGLSIALFGKSKERKWFAFTQSDSVLIGRKFVCDICVQEKEVSKIQASVFCVGGEWILRDGNFATGEKSTNGTWIYLDSPTVLQAGMVLKSHDVQLKVNLSYK